MDAESLRAEIVRLAAPRALGEATWAMLLGATRERGLQRGAHLIRMGEPADALFFVRAGLLRYYYLAEGVESTGQFFDAGMFVTDVAAFTTGAPAIQNIDALEDCEILAIPRATVHAAYDADHAFERVGRRIIEAAMSGAQRRTANFLLLSPEARYAAFVAGRPEVARRVPQYVIASYIGITPEALSRIRRRRV